MSIFHLSMQVVGRSSGRSSTAAAAYRAACRIVDERTGEVHDFTRKGGVREAFILAAASTPAWMRDRSSLWNGVERTEKRKDAQLCREVELGLPHELPHEDRRRLLIEFIESEFVRLGMIADVAMHGPGKEGDRRNEHAHVLLTMRSIEGDGFGKKNRAWNRWNDADHIENWRSRWAQLVNQALEARAVPSRVDHRSYERQARAAGHDTDVVALPTVHLGPQTSALERRGVATVPGDLNREVRVFNLELERALREAKSEAEDPTAPTPTPTVSAYEGDAVRRARLRQNLQSLLQLSAPPTVDEACAAVRRRRDDLTTIHARRIRESQALQDAIRRVREVQEAAKALGERQLAAENRLREVKQQARRHTIAMRWRQEHPLRTWLHDLGIVRSAAAIGAIDNPDTLQRQWEMRRRELAQIRARLVAAQERKEAVFRDRAQAQAQAEHEARQGLQLAGNHLDQAEALVNLLAQMETVEQQVREPPVPPVTRGPVMDHDDEPGWRPAP